MALISVSHLQTSPSHQPTYQEDRCPSHLTGSVCHSLHCCEYCALSMHGYRAAATTAGSLLDGHAIWFLALGYLLLTVSVYSADHLHLYPCQQESLSWCHTWIWQEYTYVNWHCSDCKWLLYTIHVLFIQGNSNSEAIINLLQETGQKSAFLLGHLPFPQSAVISHAVSNMHAEGCSASRIVLLKELEQEPQKFLFESCLIWHFDTSRPD